MEGWGGGAQNSLQTQTAGDRGRRMRYEDRLAACAAHGRAPLVHGGTGGASRRQQSLPARQGDYSPCRRVKAAAVLAGVSKRQQTLPARQGSSSPCRRGRGGVGIPQPTSGDVWRARLGTGKIAIVLMMHLGWHSDLESGNRSRRLEQCTTGGAHDPYDAGTDVGTRATRCRRRRTWHSVAGPGG